MTAAPELTMTVKQNKALVSYGGRSYPAAAEGVYICGRQYKKIIIFIHIHAYTRDMQLRRWKCTKEATSLIIFCCAYCANVRDPFYVW